MKTKILFILSLSCFLFSLGILLGIGCSSFRAQSIDGTRTEPISYCSFCNFEHPCILLDTVPLGKRLVIVDLLGDFPSPPIIYLSTDEVQNEIRAALNVYSETAYSKTSISLSLNSGVVFNEGETVFVGLKTSEFFPQAWITVCGYLMDT
jgi:hypothetical protein